MREYGYLSRCRCIKALTVTTMPILLFLVLGGYFDIYGMNVVGFLGVERDDRETATDVPSLDAGRVTRPRRTGLHGIAGFGGHV